MRPAYSPQAKPRGRSPLTATPGLARVVQGRVAAVLGAGFNLLLLNFLLLVTSLPVITLPVALDAAVVALDRWRCDGEDRVAREFLIALRSRRPVPTTLLIGVPLLIGAIGVEEVHYFALGGDFVSWACLGSGAAAVLVTLTALGYVLLLVARNPAAPAADLWSLCVRLAVRNLFVTGPLFLVEILGAAVLALADPPLLLLGLPIVVVYLMKVTAQFGLRLRDVQEGGTGKM